MMCFSGAIEAMMAGVGELNGAAEEAGGDIVACGGAIATVEAAAAARRYRSMYRLRRWMLSGLLGRR